MSTPVVQRVPVVVFLHSDGLAQAFAPEHVDVRFSIVPHVENVVNEALALELAERRLHRKYREICFPSNLRASEIVQKITPADLLQRAADMDLLRALESIENTAKEAAKAIAEPKKGRKLWTV
jgi:hypothetical protein